MWAIRHWINIIGFASDVLRTSKLGLVGGSGRRNDGGTRTIRRGRSREEDRRDFVAQAVRKADGGLARLGCGRGAAVGEAAQP